MSLVTVSCGDSEVKGSIDRSALAAANPDSIGAVIFTEYCKACHGANGEGVANVWPPLENSDFLKDKDRTIHSIVNGLEGSIVVNGEEYNGVMPPLPPAYSDQEVAAVVNYVVNRFGNGSWKTTPEEIAGIRE